MSPAATQRKISPQKELLLLCARQTNQDVEARIRNLVERGLDWPALLVAAADNGMAPLLCHRVGVAAGEVMPSLWHDQLRDEFEGNARRNLLLASELLRVLDAFDARGVCATPYKGPSLAVQAYG